jgi:hypothetical protein
MFKIFNIFRRVLPPCYQTIFRFVKKVNCHTTGSVYFLMCFLCVCVCVSHMIIGRTERNKGEYTVGGQNIRRMKKFV